jgi:CRP-like cAMP-binding protein
MHKDGQEFGRLDEAALALDATPADLGRWLEVCRQLSVLNARDEAQSAYRGLGKAASDTGQVALAVACAWWLRQAGARAEANQLIEFIADAHSAASTRVEDGVRPHPPAPPSRDRAQRERVDSRAPAVSRGEAVTRSKDAIEKAVELARQRDCGKLAPTVLGALTLGSLSTFISMMQAREYQTGEVIVEEGEPAGTLYWIAHGAAAVLRGELPPGELRSGAFFGDLALVGATHSNARVTAMRDTWMLEISAESVEEISKRAPGLARELAVYARFRLLNQAMRAAPLFARFSHEEQLALFPYFDISVYEQGQKVVKKGDVDDKLYVLASGGCEFDDGTLQMQLRMGHSVGERSLLARAPSSADLTATERCVLLTLSRDRFEAIAATFPSFLVEICKLVVAHEGSSYEVVVEDAADLLL